MERIQRNKVVSSGAELARLLGGKTSSPGQHIALCPAHGDKNRSLSIKDEANNKILLHCFAGCTYEEIISSLNSQGITVNHNSELARDNGLPDGIYGTYEGKSYACHWTYTDEKGNILGYAVRFESATGDKIVVPYFNRIQGKWKPGHMSKDKRPLYNLYNLSKASPEEEIYIVEGEKCADALEKMGFTATTSPAGAGSSKQADWTPLAGRHVVLWPDMDKAGRTYAVNVFQSISAVSESTFSASIIDIDKLNLSPKEDVVDWINQGGTKKDILSLPRTEINDINDIGSILVDPAHISEVIEKTEELLIKKKPYEIFQRCNQIIRIRKSSESEYGLMEVTDNYFTNLINKELTFMQWTRKGWTEMDPPAKIAQRYLDNSGHWKLFPLTGLIFAPTLRSDGTLIEIPGYDKSTGIYFAESGTKFEPISKNITWAEASEALSKLCYPFQDFPFVAQEDESVVLAAILTALVRPILKSAPLFGFSAPGMGNGKTLLANIVSLIATGRNAVATPYGSDREEERKQLFSKLLQGKPCLLLDNIERPLQSEVLCAILTAPGKTYSDRILGRSEIVEVPTNITFLATGNNLTFQGDLTRRVLLCTIDAKVEKPDSRDNFTIKNLVNHILENRATYVQAALTILKGYIIAGKPKQDIPQYGSFEEWSDLVRSALVWLGQADPCLTRAKIEKDDPIKINFSRIVNLWNTIYQNDSVTASQILNDCNTATENKDTSSDKYELAQVFMEVTRTKGKILNAEPLGKWLRSNKDKIQDGYKITKDPYVTGKKSSWILEKIQGG